MMIDAVMYGVMLSAKIVKLLNAPPENRSKRSRSPVSPENICARYSLSIPGTGMLEPILYTSSIRRVKIIFCLISGIFHALENVFTSSIR